LQVTEVSENGKWKKIRMAFDGYEGWIDRRQYVSVDKSVYDRAGSQVMPYCSSFFGLIKSETMVYPVFMGSRLPFLRNNIIELGDQYYIFEGEYTNPTSYDPIKMEVAARMYLQTPYLWGGRSHFGVDCSGFVQQIFRSFYINLPRDAWQQELLGNPVAFGDHRTGDLAFFQNAVGKVTHVGIILSDYSIIHASGYVRIDQLTSEGIVVGNTGEKTHDLCSIKRVAVHSK
jgi:gamma-D-glutamyl-L-lysine dipeptidyl-peptidase